MGEQNRQAALVTLEQVTVKKAFDSYKDQILAALDTRVVDPERFMRVALTVIRRQPKLEKCSLASILGAFVQSGQLGLYPDDLRGYIYLIPYLVTKRDDNDQILGRVFEADLMVGYQGWVELFRQSGFAAMNAVEGRIVHESDRFVFGYAMKEGRRADYYEHVPSSEQDPGPETRYYAILNYSDGTSALHVLSRSQAEAHRDEYAKSKKKQGPWFHPMQFGEMAIKTAIRKITKYAPSSPNMRTAAALEELSEAGLEQRLGAMIEIHDRVMAPVIAMPEQAGGKSTSKMAQFMSAAGVKASSSSPPAAKAEAQEPKVEAQEPAAEAPETRARKTIRDSHGNLVDAETGEILEEVDTGEAQEAQKAQEAPPKAAEGQSKAKGKKGPEAASQAAEDATTEDAEAVAAEVLTPEEAKALGLPFGGNK